MRLRFSAGGGRPPRSHEVLIVEEDGAATYVTGLPWPAQPPFDEVGAYAADLGAAAAAELHALARAAFADPPPPPEEPDTGWERISIGDAKARWAPGHAPAVATVVRAAIARLREHPLATVTARLDGDGRVHVAATGGLETRPGELRAGRGAADHPPSPLKLVTGEPVPVPGLPATLELPDPGPPAIRDHTCAWALVHVPFRSPVPGDEPAGEDAWIDGWLLAGPGPPSA